MGGVPEDKEYSQLYAHPVDHPDENEYESERLAPEDEVDDLIEAIKQPVVPVVGFGGRTL